MKFNIIVADPSWKMQDKLTMSNVKRGADANYPTMTIDDICAIPVKDIADPDGCVLALWVPSSMLADGLRVMKEWGFVQKQTYIWVKIKKDGSIYQLVNSALQFASVSKAINWIFGENALAFGMGRLFRASHEIALIGVNTTKLYKKLSNRSQRSISFSENKGHSIKPEHLQDSLDKMFNGAKLEMYARRHRQGWTCIGNEICDGEDIRVSIERLKNAT